MKLCPACERPMNNDDDGACFSNGWLCRNCGYYRSGLKRKPKTSKKRKKQVDSITDMPTSTDPGRKAPDFN